MRVNDLFTESPQLDELSAADVARGVGKTARGVGAVAGGVRGAFDAAKQGFQAGRAAVAGGGREEPATTAAQANQQGPAGTAPAQAQTGAAGAALAKSAQAVADAGTDKKQSDALYAQVKASISQLDPAGKKKILQLVQKSLAEKPPAAPAAPQQSMADRVSAAQAQQNPDAAAEPTQQAAATTTSEPAAPAASGEKLTPQQIAAKKAELQGKRAAGKTVGTTASGFNKYTKDASSQRIVGANPDGSPKIQQIKASKINLGNNLSETLAAKVEIQKRKIYEAELAQGLRSVFVK